MSRSVESAGLAPGFAALDAGRYPEAREVFGAALAREESADACDGLAQALPWLDRYLSAVTHARAAVAHGVYGLAGLLLAAGENGSARWFRAAPRLADGALVTAFVIAGDLRRR